LTDEQERQSEIGSLPKELTQAKILLEQGEFKKSFQIVLKLEKMDNLSAQELLSIKLIKAKLLYNLGEFLDTIKNAEEIYQESQKQGDLLSSFDALTIQAHALFMMGKISQSEDLIKQAEDLFKKIKETSTIDTKERESFMVRIKANIYSLKGEVHRSLELNKRAFELAKNTGNKELISASLNNIGNDFISLKDYDKAIISAKEAVKLNYEPLLAYPLGTLIEVYVLKGDIKEAKVYFKHLGELKEKFDTKSYNDMYNAYDALLLKSSLRARDRIKSEEINKKLALDKTVTHEVRIGAIIGLCDLFLIELRLTNYPEIIDEIQPYIQELLDLAESQHLYLILAETYLLRAKLSLLTFDIKKAKRFLTQAQKIAERFGHTELAERITNEQSSLLKKSNIWEKLKEMGAPMAERIKLTRLSEQIEEINEKRTVLPVFLTEEKVTIHKEKKICLVCRGEVLRFTYICECDAIYCENCARALTDLENACWVCDNPIDYSKPVKLYKEEVGGKNVDNKGKK